MRFNTVEVIFRISSNKKGTGIDVTRVGELTRCGDCKFWEPTDCSSQARCSLSGMYPTASWYCGNAERRET